MRLQLTVNCNGDPQSVVEAKVHKCAFKKLKEEVDQSDYVEIVNEELLAIKCIFGPERRVPDVWRYTLRNTGSYISLLEHSGAIETVCQEKNKFRDLRANAIIKGGIVIVLLLESPHKEEFDSNDRPIAPAQGTTGTNIHEYFEHLINIDRGMLGLVKTEASLIICNPIPFQTSLHMIHKGKISRRRRRELKEYVWKALWNDRCVRDDFKKRMDAYGPRLIINACTGGTEEEGLNAIVTCYLKSSKIGKNICRTSHPSSWKIPKLQSL